MGQYDITIASANPTPSFTTTSFRVAEDAIQQDITPASTRRSDGDTRFLTIPTESFWSQNDVGGGFGKHYPSEATTAEELLGDTLDGVRIRAPFLATSVGNASMPASYELIELVAHRGQPYAAILNGATYQLFRYTAGAWSFVVNLTTLPYMMASFRDTIWVCYGSAANVRAITAAGVATDKGFTAEVLCPYGSMMFYVYYVTASDTFALNRYDPENTTAIPDLGIFPISSTVDTVRSMAALGPDLYICWGKQLWKFTSANGNSGVLIGPIDTWVATGAFPQGAAVAGYGMTAFQGAVFYPIGAGLRRYQPGGAARTIWPTPAYDALYSLSRPMVLSGLLAFDDKLWLVGAHDAASATTQVFSLLCWTGLGMQRLAQRTIVSGTAFQGSALPHALITIGDGRVFLGLAGDGGASTGDWLSTYIVAGSSARAYETGTIDQVYKSSILEFGMVDIKKAVSQVGVSAIVPAGQDITVWASVDNGTLTQMTKSGSFSTTAPDICYFVPASGRVLVGKRFQFVMKFSMGGISTTTPEVYGILCIPNPINPLRSGFRFTILIDEGVLDHTTNTRLYATSAAVTTAVALVRQLRTEDHPLLLTWEDGLSYYVRINSKTIRRARTRKGAEPSWRCDLDVQEIS